MLAHAASLLLLTPPLLLPQVLPLVVQSLPMLAQRATYIRAFLIAMPERAQQIGVMIALGVDPGEGGGGYRGRCFL